MNEIIEVTQLPIISEQLAKIKKQVAERVEKVSALVCTDDTVKEVKKARAELNAEFKAWEDKRKEVKAAVLTPYEQFETVYADCISTSYKDADKILKKKIDDVEGELKKKKTEEVKTYFAEYSANANIDFVTFDQAEINVTLSASVKSLKEAAKNFIDKVVEDLNLINTFNNSAEILVEYKKSLNVSASITNVTARMQAIEAEKKKQEAEQERKEAEEKRIEEVKQAAKAEAPEVLPAPKQEENKDEQILTLRFQVTASRAKLKVLKTFLDNGGYEYV